MKGWYESLLGPNDNGIIDSNEEGRGAPNYRTNHRAAIFSHNQSNVCEESKGRDQTGSQKNFPFLPF